VSGAEDQQERLIQLGWVVGFVDGEGCFSIGFVRQPDRARRKGYRTGYQVSHEFVVTQGAKSVSCLRELVRFFGVGGVLPNRRYDNHKEHLYRYGVRARAELVSVIIPFFESYPMKSAKQEDFEKFARCVRMIDAGLHRTREGLVELAEIAETMNRRKPRTEMIRILRGHTPEVQDTGS
jgi:LAGLIDADG endonuclease